MQLVPLGFNKPRFQKVFYHKRLTQITTLTSKNAINELSKHHRWSRGHKARGQGQEHKQNSRPRTALPRTDPLKAKDRNA